MYKSQKLVLRDGAMKKEFYVMTRKLSNSFIRGGQGGRNRGFRPKVLQLESRKGSYVHIKSFDVGSFEH